MTDIAHIQDFLKKYDGPPVKIMEVCGTHTQTILRGGIRGMLSPRIQLVSGPGCPVCVTVSAYIDKLVELSLIPGNTVVTFGDMLKVPGSRTTLQAAKARGGSAEMVYAPGDIIRLAKARPDRIFIFAAVGFETTLAAYAALVADLLELRDEVPNIRLLTATKVILPALDLVCRNFPDIDAFIAPGNVSIVIGAGAYKTVAEKYQRPFAVCGFEAESVLTGVYDLVKQRNNGTFKVHNLYPAFVSPGGNRSAQDMIARYFETGPASWRGFGEIADSGIYLKPEFAPLDAGSRGLDSDSKPGEGCICAEVIAGRKPPGDCRMFMNGCRPQSPFGACMATEEGACRIEASGC